MESNPIPIDFDIDNMFIDGKQFTVPKFVKAMIRLAKVVVREKQKLLFVYPNYKCEYIPVIGISSYFHFVKQKQSRTGFKLLIVTNSGPTVRTYQKMCNNYGNPFIDFIYSGYLSKNGYRRLKPEGSTRGSVSGKILLEQSNVFIVKPGSMGDILDHHFDFAIVEDCQKFLTRRYFDDIKKLSESNIPVLAVMTAPDFVGIEKYKKLFDFKIIGWDEELLLKDARFFNDIYASSKNETFFPTLKEIEMPLDEYHQYLNFLLSAFRKSRKVRTGLKNDPNIERIFIDIHRIIRTLTTLAFPYQILCDVESEFGYVPTDKRMAITRGLISQLPSNVNETLEFGKIMDMCDVILRLKPTKQKFYEDNLSENMIQFVAFPDKITEVSMKRYFTNKLGLNTITPGEENQMIKSKVILNNLSGKLTDDYKIIKSIKTEKLEVLTYTHEKEILRKMNESRNHLKQLLAMRNKVLEELHVTSYS